MMQFRDLKAQYQALKTEIDAGMADVLASGQFILGKQVGELEQKLAEDVKRPYCVSCANGTDALVLSLMLWGIGPGDAAFVPDFTYFATAGCASTVGADGKKSKRPCKNALKVRKRSLSQSMAAGE